MDPVILRFASYEFSPFRSTVDAHEHVDHVPQLSSLADGPASPPPWIRRLSRFCQSGIAQAAIIALSLVYVVVVACRSRGRRTKASPIRWRYELPSQAARAAALASLAVAFVRHQNDLPSLILAIHLFVLGLLRIARHQVLKPVNLVTLAALLLLSAIHLLPCAQMGRWCTVHLSIAAAAASLFAALACASLTPREWACPRVDHIHDMTGLELPPEPTTEETCSWINYYCTYDWLTPIIWKGTTGKLDMSSVPKLAWYDEPLHLLGKIQAARAVSKTTLWTTVRFQRTELFLMSFWVGCSYIVENIAPYAMFRLLQYLNTPADAVYHPWVWLMLMFAGPVCRSVMFQQYIFISTRLTVRIKSAMTQELYHRALQSMELEEDPFELVGAKSGPREKSDKSHKSTSSGRLANLMAADVDAVFRARDMIIALFGVPLGTIVSLIGLYKMLGWASLVGILILSMGVPISAWFGKMMYGTQKRVRKAQDARISLVAEYLASIRTIKYFAWESPVTEKLIAARAVEQKGLWTLAVLQAVVNEVSHVFPYIALLVLFGLHIGFEKKPLEASTAFTTLYLVKNIRRNIMMASMCARSFAAALVAFGRLDKYFESTVPLTKHAIGPLRIERGHFRKSKKATFCLEDISLDFVEGGLNVITGQSGCGKSTLLLAILGETYVEGGSVTAPEDIAFASQSAWLQNETIQDNILFGSPKEEVRYGRVLAACCLGEDLDELPLRDQTAVGEDGTALSGGQKARVALARALYSRAPLLLLDDVFSALDAKTSAGVWKHCFCSDLLRGRTVVLVTQVPWIAAQADISITLDNGRVKSVEPNIGVVRRPIKIADVLGGDGDVEGGQAETALPNGHGLGGMDKTALDTAVGGDRVDEEMKATGKAGRLGMMQYMRYFGHPLFAVVCLVGLVLANAFFFSSSLWLSVWVEAYSREAHVDVAFYMTVFALLTVSELMSYGLVVILFEWGSWRAARRLHNDFVRSIMRVPLSWFKAVPAGRVTNRFSGDMTSIDGALGPMLRTSVDAFIQLLFRIGAVSTIMPVFMLPGLAACCVGVVVGEMYTRTAVVLKRLSSSAQSPVFSQFADTLGGLPVIRARHAMAEAFCARLADKLRLWSAAAETSYNCNRWVSVRIDLVTALVALSAGIIAVSQVGLVGAGLVGFSLTSANELSLTILLLVRATNELEVEMQSFHRVREYARLVPEGKDDKTMADQAEDDASVDNDDGGLIPRAWPRSGRVEFRNVTVRYDAAGPDILSDINLVFRAGRRVAVVGRTGSGKSTLVLSLLRFTDIVSGQILFDGIDITEVPRRRLRQAMTIIPQEAVLFSGSVASNLDPTGLESRAHLDAALENCKGIASFDSRSPEDDDEVDTDPGASDALSLATEVHARGDNFSHGQRQVLSLCRALVRDSRLMLLDEATASMDYDTDRGIQRVLRADMSSPRSDGVGARTLVTIAHRLRTIIDYDVIVVMSAGRVLEHGSPKDLYSARGQFYDIVCHSGEEAELRDLLDET